MTVLLKKEGKVGTRKVVYKKHINTSQEVNFRKKVVVHMTQQEEMDG